MPLRPPFLLPLKYRPWICATCLHHTTPPLLPRIAQFHSTPRFRAIDPPTHYETLDLPQTASPADIKRQFYALSKQHHPDRNPSDPNASTRFVAISEAYHVLSVPEKRTRYDAELQHAQAQAHGRSRWGTRFGSGGEQPRGSYSSASYAGSRPASGLNKKRGTFRGPPPSFYKSGGYGAQGAKRAEYAERGGRVDSSNEATGAASGQGAEAGPESYGQWGGYGPGQQRQGHEVPHFDDVRHKERHDNINDFIRARRRRATGDIRLEEDIDRGGQLVNFILVSGVIALVGMTSIFFQGRDGQKKGQQQDEP